MQQVVFDKPYRFVPPHLGRFWPTVLRPFLPWYLKRFYGITSVDCRGTETLRASVEAGHGILLAPNHCRPCDPMLLGSLIRHIGTPLSAMGSWHLFMQDRFTAWLARRAGAFSVYREGMDRQAVAAALDILEHARRPLIIFAEGVVTRMNDRVAPLQEGVAFIARTAAKKRSKASPPGKVVVHPVAIKYIFQGDLPQTVEPVLSEIEHRLSWQPQRQLPLLGRIGKLGEALLSLKEIEYFGHAQPGDLGQRLERLIHHLLAPLEDEWVESSHEGHVVARVKRLRTAILPDMVKGEISAEERDRRWRQLADVYLAQQLSWYPPDYIRDRPTPERILETVERFEEDLTDDVRPHPPLHAVIQVDDALEVDPERPRNLPSDPLLVTLRERLQQHIDHLQDEFRPTPVSPPETVPA